MSVLDKHIEFFSPADSAACEVMLGWRTDISGVNEEYDVW